MGGRVDSDELQTQTLVKMWILVKMSYKFPAALNLYAPISFFTLTNYWLVKYLHKDVEVRLVDKQTGVQLEHCAKSLLMCVGSTADMWLIEFEINSTPEYKWKLWGVRDVEQDQETVRGRYLMKRQHEEDEAPKAAGAKT